uniref:Uncharacterized protein n=1 Tax=Arundo donax TaxID=35708 RepID=A0A0A9C3T0_ARUDO
MDALMANYASDSDSDGGAPELPKASALLPPPPLDLLQPITRQCRRGVASGASPMWKATTRYMSTSLFSYLLMQGNSWPLL